MTFEVRASLSLPLVWLLSGCATAAAATGRPCEVVIERTRPSRPFVVLGSMWFSDEDIDLPALRQKACEAGADAMILSRAPRSSTRQRGPSWTQPTDPLNSFAGLVVLGAVALVDGLDAAAAARLRYVATAIRWGEDSRSYEGRSSSVTTLPARLQARARKANAQLEANPGDEAALAEYLTVSEQTADWAGAKGGWNRFLSTRAADPAHRLGYARWLWRHEFDQEALEQAKLARAATPPPRGASSFLGQVLAESGQIAAARAELQRALEEDPDDGDARDALSALPAGDAPP